ncbi:universal stress protein [Pelomicrobium sp.]|jgi:nucleotide-binding universal stress UspA family protein|uniref:universal stress protein n=1 Tax=Pelomicrobium sp. TaxID=2815319 RepID=UPI002FDCF991
MFKHILLPTDGSELSQIAITKGIAFAKSIGARVTGLHVAPEFEPIAYDGLMPVDPITDEQFAEEARARGKTYLAAIERAAQEAGVPCETVFTTGHHPFELIIRTAEERGCDLIVMASHGRRGIASLLLGGETMRVLSHTKIPVLVFR